MVGFTCVRCSFVLSQAQTSRYHDWHAFRTLDLEASWSVEWFVLSDSSAPVGYFKPGEVLASAIRDSAMSSYYKPKLSRNQLRDKSSGSVRAELEDDDQDPFLDEPDDGDVDVDGDAGAAAWAAELDVMAEVTMQPIGLTNWISIGVSCSWWSRLLLRAWCFVLVR